ncbi:hypothetical protein [Beijerinckia sp. L45]|uniref:hypothetical protein n=1 Tax=Beijerinckia sp. L45 TaxID=1641855 RepID=UPI00131A9F18|nr:hypothetical protein [Beijerinckia sp. L45]
MTDEEVLTSLRKKRDEIERQINSFERKISTLEKDLSSMRNVLEHHKQDIVSAEFLPHMSVRRLFLRGEIRGYCLEALQNSTEAMSTRELTRVVVAKKGLDVNDAVIRTKVVFSVFQTLKTAVKRGLIKDTGTRRKGVRLWRI